METQQNSAGLSSVGGEHTASRTTIASDSSPFRDKYDMDEELEILGEVSYSNTCTSFVPNSY